MRRSLVATRFDHIGKHKPSLFIPSIDKIIIYKLLRESLEQSGLRMLAHMQVYSPESLGALKRVIMLEEEKAAAARRLKAQALDIHFCTIRCPHGLTILIDLLRLANIESRMREFNIAPEPNIVEWGFIWFPGNNGTYCSQAYIKVPLIHFEPSGFQHTRQILTLNYFQKSYYSAHNTKHAIAPGSAPSVARLLQAYLTSRGNRILEAGPFSRLSRAFRDFAETYCENAAELPLV